MSACMTSTRDSSKYFETYIDVWSEERVASRARVAALRPNTGHFTRRRLSPYLLSVNSALQYGHFAQPVFSIGKNTRGCEFHRCMPGIGHDSGRSAAVIVYWFLAFGWMSLVDSLVSMVGSDLGRRADYCRCGSVGCEVYCVT